MEIRKVNVAKVNSPQTLHSSGAPKVSEGNKAKGSEERTIAERIPDSYDTRSYYYDDAGMYVELNHDDYDTEPRSSAVETVLNGLTSLAKDFGVLSVMLLPVFMIGFMSLPILAVYDTFADAFRSGSGNAQSGGGMSDYTEGILANA